MIPWLLDGKTTGPGLAERELVLPGGADSGNETRRISLDIPNQKDGAGNAVRDLDARSASASEDAATAMNLPAPARAAQQSSGNQARAAASQPAAQTPVPEPTAQRPSSSAAEVPARFRTPMPQNSAGGEPAKPPAVVAAAAAPATSRTAEPAKPVDEPAPSSPAAGRPAVAQSASPPRPAATVSPAPAPAPAASSQWAVQVGSFASKDNAERLSGVLKGKSYNAFVMPNEVNGRVLYRVRVGPVAQRSEADLLAAALREDRQPARVLSHP